MKCRTIPWSGVILLMCISLISVGFDCASKTDFNAHVEEFRAHQRDVAAWMRDHQNEHISQPPGQTPPPPTAQSGQLTAGSWEVVSIENIPVEKYFVPLDADYTDTESKIAQNDFVFFPNGTWYWTLDLKITAKLKDGSGLAYLPEVAMAGRGAYTQSGMKLVLALEKLDAQLRPPDFWSSAGITEEGFAKAVTTGRLFGKVENWNMSFVGNTLTLTSTDGNTKQVLRKKQ